MPLNLRGRHYIAESDFRPDEITYLLDLARDLKRARASGFEQPRLAGKQLALIFEKDSTRTRCAFEVAATDQGAHTTYLGPTGSQIGHKESVRDTAAVLGRMYDGIEYRGFAHSSVEELAANAGVPVWNGLTDSWHPTQSLCDVFTMREHSDKPLGAIAYAYVGDARNNMGNSLLTMGALLGMDVRIGAPRQLWPAASVVERAQLLAESSGGRVTVTDDVTEAVHSVDFVHTDVWLSMGESSESWPARIELLRPYQVNVDVLKSTGNPRVRFMHCLPALHDRQTSVGAALFREHGLDGAEVTDEVFRSAASIVFDQAENRLHTIKAILVATLGR